jgi:2-succinyl-6-hydroxy-2,4-cyclohexadiene-1-carboxylate synthase
MTVLAFERHGAGPRVVLVHGFTQTGRSFRAHAAALAADHEVVTVDLPGHGDSAAVEVADLDEAARLLGIAGGKATYVGYSLGGRVALHLALARPELVDHLVCVSVTPGIEDFAVREARRAADEALADRLERGAEASRRDEGRCETELLRDFLEREWLMGPLFRHLSAEAADVPTRLANTAAGLAQSLRTNGTGTQRPLFDRLGELNSAGVPVTIVAGADDQKFVAIARRMSEVLFGSPDRALVIEGSGHSVPFEVPERFLALVRQVVSDPATQRRAGRDRP